MLGLVGWLYLLAQLLIYAAEVNVVLTRRLWPRSILQPLGFTNLLNVGLGVAVTVAAFYLMWGAFIYMSASGSPHQMERGKSAMLNALAGLAIVLASRIIVGMIQSALGTGP